MKKIISLTCKVLFSLSLFLPFHFLESCITEIDSFKKVDFKRLSSSSGKLFIFDVDDTLVRPIDAYLSHEDTLQGLWFRYRLSQEYPHITKEEWRNINGIIIKDAQRPLIEPDIINSINELKKNNIPVIACTAMNIGRCELLPITREQWRYEHLKSLGFEGSFSDVGLEFNFTRQNILFRFIFYAGILATNGLPKGPVIGAFLNEMQLKPNEIIMFDDCLEFLKSVQEECKNRKIAFNGYHYKGAPPLKPWDAKLFAFQIDYVVKHKKWLDDETARTMLNTK